jgi:voltage-gated potassium channel
VEGDTEHAEALSGRGNLVVAGDATEDDVLLRAGVKRAKALVAVVSRDVDNLYIVLSARELCRQDNPNLYILSRATDDTAMTKITRAGADRVISPYTIGGMRLVQALLRPTVYDFVEIATESSGLDLMFEELRVGPDSQLASVALRDSNIRQEYDVVIIAVKKESGGMVFNPGPNYVLQTGDTVITLGNRDQLSRLARAL